ncbi:MAG: anhydro-N-acetylmuramic acid kinase [Bacteroidetes bacterium]|nr:anhydro-N-acetylmuramic acid kinase [Bacteroidota bacterium]
MLYRVIGIMSGSSLDGIDLAYVLLEEQGGKWTYTLQVAECYSYEDEWLSRLQTASSLNARDFMRLHADYGHYVGKVVNRFIQENGLEYKVGLLASHGHTVFHEPGVFTVQIGDGSAIAAETALPVVSDFRAMDVALGGQGAPIVPMGEKLLFSDHACLLNIGGIANISLRSADGNYVAFDVCPANRVLNLLANKEGKAYDDDGHMARTGTIHAELLNQLNALPFYAAPFPKSLDNSFGVDQLFPMIEAMKISSADALATYTEHIAQQVGNAVATSNASSMLITGGGALNGYLLDRIRHYSAAHGVEAVVPDKATVLYKEALIMALLGVLRWREEETVLSSVTGARQSSIGGALWMGHP